MTKKPVLANFSSLGITDLKAALETEQVKKTCSFVLINAI